MLLNKILTFLIFFCFGFNLSWTNLKINLSFSTMLFAVETEVTNAREKALGSSKKIPSKLAGLDLQQFLLSSPEWEDLSKEDKTKYQLFFMDLLYGAETIQNSVSSNFKKTLNNSNEKKQQKQAPKKVSALDNWLPFASSFPASFSLSFFRHFSLPFSFPFSCWADITTKCEVENVRLGEPCLFAGHLSAFQKVNGRFECMPKGIDYTNKGICHSSQVACNSMGLPISDICVSSSPKESLSLRCLNKVKNWISYNKGKIQEAAITRQQTLSHDKLKRLINGTEFYEFLIATGKTYTFCGEAIKKVAALSATKKSELEQATAQQVETGGLAPQQQGHMDNQRYGANSLVRYSEGCVVGWCQTDAWGRCKANSRSEDRRNCPGGLTTSSSSVNPSNKAPTIGNGAAFQGQGGTFSVVSSGSGSSSGAASSGSNLGTSATGAQTGLESQRQASSSNIGSSNPKEGCSYSYACNQIMSQYESIYSSWKALPPELQKLRVPNSTKSNSFNNGTDSTESSGAR